MMRRTFWIGGIAAALLALTTGCSFSHHDAAALSGTLEAEELPVVAEVGGTLLKLDVDEGAAVKKNDVLAVIDDRSYALAVKEAEAALMQATARLEEAKAGSRNQTLKKGAAQVQQAASAVTVAQARVRQAKANLDRVQDQMNQAQSQLEGAKQTLAYQQSRLQDTNRLFASGAVSKRDLDAQAEVVNQAQTQVNQLRAQLSSTQAQYAAAKEDWEAAQATVGTSKAQMDSAQADLALLQEGSTDYNLKALLAAQLQAQAKLDEARLQEEKTQVLASADGSILRKNVTQGELAKAGSTLFTMMKKDQLKVKVYIPEAELGQVHVGQKVTVKVDAYPNEQFPGVIRSIADKAEFTPKNVQTTAERTKMVFAVTVAMESGFDKLRPGMPADVYVTEQVGAK
ncbi:HlyD family secretion protein [Brevibacillus fluminis]|uniref:HlyD family secretion protein n=1 Tax=Brevibacillus fluminis TaxID=511487 RepID=UPI003F89FDDB